MLDVAALFAHWSPARIRSVTVPDSGVMNQTFVIETGAGRFVLRAYRPLERARIEREHVLIAYASERGLPAPCPLPAADGRTLLEREGRNYALFPYAAGSQVVRAELTAVEAAASGRFLARLHDAIRGFGAECPARLHELATPPDRARTLAGIDELLRVVRSWGPRGECEETALRRLEDRRRWLNESPAPDHHGLRDLPEQALHGDYQETNLFFDAGEVSAVIDWEKAYRGPCGWEVMRALDLMLRFDPELGAPFLDGYRGRLPLSDEELDLAAAGYAEMRANDLWLYNSIYLEGNDRVRRFIRPGPFVPLTDRWAAFRRGVGWGTG